jgi:hypothetical protein
VKTEIDGKQESNQQLVHPSKDKTPNENRYRKIEHKVPRRYEELLTLCFFF